MPSLKHFATPALIALAAVATSTSFGEGFRNPPAGAFSLGRAGGRYAQNDDPSTVQHNPANFVEFETPTLSIAPSFVYISIEHTALNGTKTETRDPWKSLPNLFATVPIMKDKLSFGVGITTPYGLSSEWERNGSFNDPTTFRFQTAWYTEMKTINVNPALSYKINDQLSVGAGLNVHWSQLVFKQFIPLGTPLGSVTGNAKAKGDGYGLGGNIGLTWEPVEGHRIAATYRSPVEVSYDGDTKTDFGVTTGFDTRVRFPTIISLAYGIEITENLRLEISSEWLEFSRFENLNINALGTTTRIRHDWNDTFTFGFGGDWKFAPNWTLRAGYQYYMSPVPDATFTPTIPDANQNVFTTGLQYSWGRHAVEGAYGGIFYDDRNIRNGGPFDGTYKMNVHLFALSYNFRF